MAIRPGVFRIGETVEITAAFTETDGSAMDATGITLTFRRPDGTLDVDTLTADGGIISVDYKPNMVGTWHFRLECEFPTQTVMESKFEVVASTVLLPVI